MKKINVLPNQTLYDIVIREYGNCEAISEVLSFNTDLENDPQALEEAGFDNSDPGFFLDLPVREGSTVWVDEISRLRRKNIIREIDKEITTYDFDPEERDMLHVTDEEG
ncbi:MAG: hypothetical protein LUF85_04450 [Bacteroides sp.]|nr:hypothetical protein [Bacteroides sp.]